ncbi:MAG: symmetrical bis(5'-nucleosyl)-tetraphosphatase, partial [Mariprofundaceae bacterium]
MTDGRRVFAIGDIQGCFMEMRDALDAAGFDARRDELWCVGDLVNRGPDSLTVLRFLRGLGRRCRAVLGNHDLQLLARWAGGRGFRGDTLDAVLGAPDAAELVEWLRRRPLLHRDRRLGWMMVHAGLAPSWSPATVCRRARRLERVLRGRRWRRFCRGLQRRDWPVREPRGPRGRLVFAAAVFTRIRWCGQDGRMAWQARANAPDAGEAAWLPWFDHPDARWRGG